MQKCYYHSKTEAVTMCMGCKMPICPACRDEGKRGFCERCMKKVASLGEQVTDQKKTGMVNAKKATILKSALKPPGEPDAVHCFHHFDILASATCPTCNRPFCPACLNTAGICSHCAQHNEEAQAILFSPTEQGRALAEDRPRRRTAAPPPPEPTFFERHRLPILGGGALLLVLLLVAVLHHGAPRHHSQAAQDLETLKNARMSHSEQALVSRLAKSADQATSLDDQGAQGRVLAHGSHVAGGGPLYVAIYAPSSGATVSGMTTIKARAGGALDHVDLAVDGQWQGSMNAAPYDIDWASQSVSNGPHRVTLTAVGTDGRQTVSRLLLNVRN
ncbi:MAG TPA: Ig-like domain-containing protein [Oscillatoriaceae cyanobacterium]